MLRGSQSRSQQRSRIHEDPIYFEDPVPVPVVPILRQKPAAKPLTKKPAPSATITSRTKRHQLGFPYTAEKINQLEKDLPKNEQLRDQLVNCN